MVKMKKLENDKEERQGLLLQHYPSEKDLSRPIKIIYNTLN